MQLHPAGGQAGRRDGEAALKLWTASKLAHGVLPLLILPSLPPPLAFLPSLPCEIIIVLKL